MKEFKKVIRLSLVLLRHQVKTSLRFRKDFLKSKRQQFKVQVAFRIPNYLRRVSY